MAHSKKLPTHTTRESWLHAAMAQLSKTVFADAGYKVPKKIRVGVGFPSTGRRGRRIGEAWSAENSGDKTHEIIVHNGLGPNGEKSQKVRREATVRLLGILVHEMVHCTVGIEAGHGPLFRACATRVGLTGKMTATTETPFLVKQLEAIAKELGRYPHAKLTSSGRKKQTTRMVKVCCDGCGLTFRTTRKWLEAAELPECWSCGGDLEAD